MSTATLSLSSWLLSRFQRYKTNREPLERDWYRNWAAYIREPRLLGAKWKDGEALKAWQSRAISALTKVKCKTAYAQIMDVLTESGRIAFMLSPDDSDFMGASPAPGVPAGAPVDPGRRDASIARFEALIHKQMDACDGPEELALIVLTACVLGECYAKRIIHGIEEDAWDTAPDGTYTSRTVKRDAPAIVRVTPWAIFRDLEARRLQEGEGLFERDYWTPFQLASLRGQPLTIPAALEEALKTKASTATGSESDDSPTRDAIQEKGRSIRMLEYWGLVPRDRVQEFLRATAGEDFPSAVGTLDEESDMVECMALLADDHIVRFALTEKRDRPHYRMAFEEGLDALRGVGVADNVAQEQATITGALRTFEDLCKKLSNYTVAKKARLLDDADEEIEPGGTIFVAEDCDDVRKAIMPLEQPHDALNAITQGMEMFMGLADLSSMIPKATQGEQEMNAQTAFELSARLERAGKYLLGAIRNADRMVEDIIRDFYRWNMRDPHIPADWKGKWKVRAMGVHAFENRMMRTQHLMMLLELSQKDPDVRARLRLPWILEELARARSIPTEQLLRPETEVQAQAPAAPAPPTLPPELAAALGAA